MILTCTFCGWDRCTTVNGLAKHLRQCIHRFDKPEIAAMLTNAFADRRVIQEGTVLDVHPATTITAPDGSISVDFSDRPIRMEGDHPHEAVIETHGS